MFATMLTVYATEVAAERPVGAVENYITVGKARAIQEIMNRLMSGDWIKEAP